LRGIRKASAVDSIAQAQSVRKDEVFRATRTGLERLQTNKLRSGGKQNRMDELPYHRISSVSFEERVVTRGSKPLSVLGVFLLLMGLGLPALSGLVSMLNFPGQSARIAGLGESLALPDLAGVAIGVGLLASRFPRSTREGWWQVRGLDLAPEDQRGWQVAAGEKGADDLVRAVREGISRAANPYQAKK
jgi:hypothetical protein